MNSGRLKAAALCGALVLALLVTPFGGAVLGQRANGADPERCARFAFQSAARERVVTGRGEQIAVLGDSYSVGLGLANPRLSWPARLPGRTETFGFSGSGFATGSSPCHGADYPARVRHLVRDAARARTVVVEGGLNDVDRTGAAIRRGLHRVLAALDGRQVLVVGPVPAPARIAGARRVDAVLAAECRRLGVPYLSMIDLTLPYLPDRLHLTRAGHRAFGDAVAARLAALD